jgi:hypothetical protein
MTKGPAAELQKYKNSIASVFSGRGSAFYSKARANFASRRTFSTLLPLRRSAQIYLLTPLFYREG